MKLRRGLSWRQLAPVILFACTSGTPALNALDALCDAREGIDQVQEAAQRGDLREAIRLLREYTERHSEDTKAKDVLLLLEAELAKLAIPQ